MAKSNLIPLHLNARARFRLFAHVGRGDSLHAMKSFLVMVEGHGFLTDFGNGSELIGFFANRVVEAPNAGAINEGDLFDRIRRDLETANVRHGAAAIMRVAEVSEFSAMPDREYVGFSFFPDGGLISRLWFRIKATLRT